MSFVSLDCAALLSLHSLRLYIPPRAQIGARRYSDGAEAGIL